MADQNNQDLIKIVQDSQKTSRWSSASTAVAGISGLVGAIISGILLWKSIKRSKTSPKVRSIRQKGRIDRVKLRHRAERDKMELRHKVEMERELLELDIIEREVKHEAELRELEVGLEKKEEKEAISETDNFIENLKGTGKEVLVKKAVENQIKDAKDKLKDKFFK